MKYFDRVKVNIATLGTGDVTFGSAVSSAFLTPSQAGAVDGDVTPYVIVDGTDFEEGTMEVSAAGTEGIRTVSKSVISGVVGASKLNLSGTATLSFTIRAADLSNLLEKDDNLASLDDADTALDNLGFSALGKSLVAATNVQDAREIASALTVVRTVATANVSIASGLEAGDAVSGVTLATNDLVLLTAQTAPAENGVYVVAASGAAARHASFATYDAHPGCYFSVCEGTGVADTLWRCTSDRGGTLGTTALAFSQFSSGGGSDYDYLINGDGQVNQAVAGAGIADGAYGHDQWVALTQTGAIAVSTLTDVEDGLPSMIRLTQSQATAQRMGYIQPLEASRVKRLRGKLVTMVMRLRNSTGAAIRYAVVEHTGPADTLTNDIVNDWTSGTYMTGNFFASQSGNITVRAVGSVTPAASTLMDATLQTTLGSTFNNLYVFVWTEGAAAQNATLDLAVNLRRGNATTPVAMRPFQDELTLCQRYYEKTYPLGDAPGTAYGTSTGGGPISTYIYANANYASVSFGFKATKRVSPTVTTYSPVTGASGVIRNANGAVDLAAEIFVNDNNATIRVSNVNVNAINFVHVHAVVNARL